MKDDQVADTNPLITSVPLTAEAREELLDDLFRDQLPYYGEVFLPTDDFYIARSRTKQAQHICHELCEWLGIKPGYISLQFEGQAAPKHTDAHRVVFLSRTDFEDEYRTSATIAYSLTRYLVEDRKQIHLPELELQTALLATATVLFGLGLIMLNGNQPHYGKLWPKKPVVHLPANYTELVRNFFKKQLIPASAYIHTLMPWAAQALGLKISPHPTHAAKDAKHRTRVNHLKTIGLTWSILTVASLIGFTYVQRVKPEPAQVRDATAQVNLLEYLSNACRSRYKYDRQYADLTDIQTTRVLNAEAARCQSLQDQQAAAQTQLNQLSHQ